MKRLTLIVASAVFVAAPLAASIPLAHAADSPAPSIASTGDVSIRPFKAHFSDAQLADLRRRIAETRWPDAETVTDRSQGAQLARLQALVNYWGHDYDWRRAEAQLNALPQYVTTIDGVDIHFIWVRSKNRNALPLIMTHGWPGSVFEELKVIGPLTDPVAHGGRAEDAFDLVLPSMPGYGFSGKPKNGEWTPDHIARAWGELMHRLGYTQYVAQGGDWGSVVADKMAEQKLPGLLGIHVNMPATVPPEVAKSLKAGDPPPPGLDAKETAAYRSLDTLYTRGGGYAAMMVTRPQTVGYALADSPVGQAAWMYDKFADWTYSGGDPERSLTKDEMLDDITLYWLTNTSTSAAQLYWANNANNFNAVDISIPAAITVFPGEIYQAPRSWAERSYHDLIYFNEVNKGGHFAAWEQPDLFAQEVRAGFRPVRR
jgi:pimeloyl-ACP methyl ester carboxylesterase